MMVRDSLTKLRDSRGCVTWRRNMACARARFEELIELGELHLSRGAVRVCDLRALSREPLVS